MKRVFLIKRHPMGQKFLAICLFGFVFTVRPLTRTELNHELIHVAQQREMLYIPFFLCYFVEWLYHLCRRRNWMQAYMDISFEREAYRYQSQLDYLSHRRHYAMFSTRPRTPLSKHRDKHRSAYANRHEAKG